MGNEDEKTSIRILCRRIQIVKNELGLQWLIGSQSFPSLTIVSTLRCIHTLPLDPLSPDFGKESYDIRTLIPKGLEVIGALIINKADADVEKIAAEAIGVASKLRSSLYGDKYSKNGVLIGAAVESNSNNDVRYFVAKAGNLDGIGSVATVVNEAEPEKYFWERGCLLRCEVPIKLPIYYSPNNPKEAETLYRHAVEVAVSRFRDPDVAYILEPFETSAGGPPPIVIHGSDLDSCEKLLEADSRDSGRQSDAKSYLCSYLCPKQKGVISHVSNEEIKFQATVFLNKSRYSPKTAAPFAEYYPAREAAKLLMIEHKLEVLCYVSKDKPLRYAVSELLIPALADQLSSMTSKVLLDLLTQQAQLYPYHFLPAGLLHPITVLYELRYGETELKQVEIRRSLHIRLGLPLDRPLLRVANAVSFSSSKDGPKTKIVGKGSSLLKDVHLGIPNSGVPGGMVSLIQGSYGYYHYLHDGFDDSGWGCAYRSLQTIISWFRLQHYTSIDVPSHREIQQILVDIGDKDPSFVGSREWIGAIELSFVIDKLIGASCKVINVRSGSELPEKCRELALHFESQGTPVMIGGGVLAYTLLGVDYNEASGDYAFLILDPHYTGNDDLKKIVNGGWCGWKKAVDSKGKPFFLHDKFYNLLLPQRPNMV